jgi:hypothetical protein
MIIVILKSYFKAKRYNTQNVVENNPVVSRKKKFGVRLDF